MKIWSWQRSYLLADHTPKHSHLYKFPCRYWVAWTVGTSWQASSVSANWPQCLLDSLLPVQVFHAHLEPRGQGRLLDSCTAVSSGWNCIRHWLHSGSVANLEQRGQKRLPDGYTPLLTDWVISVTWFTQMLLEIWRSIDSWEHTSTCLIVTSTAWLIQVLC